MHLFIYFWCDLHLCNFFLKVKNKIIILEQPPSPSPTPLKITFNMGVQNHAGRLLEPGGGSEAS